MCVIHNNHTGIKRKEKNKCEKWKGHGKVSGGDDLDFEIIIKMSYDNDRE